MSKYVGALIFSPFDPTHTHRWIEPFHSISFIHLLPSLGALGAGRVGGIERNYSQSRRPGPFLCSPSSSPIFFLLLLPHFISFALFFRGVVSALSRFWTYFFWTGRFLLFLALSLGLWLGLGLGGSVSERRGEGGDFLFHFTFYYFIKVICGFIGI